jgi:hypothetical protein
MSKFNAIFLPLAFTVLVIAAGLYYYKNNSENTQPANNSGGQSQIMGTSTDSAAMSDYNEYSIKVLDVRSPINKNIEDLMSKTKYSTLFDKETVIKQANDIKSAVESGIKTLENLKLNTSLKAINQKQISSLKLLDEAMDAYIAFQNTEDKTEQQKQSELVSYKIDESNKQIQNAASGSSSSSNNSNSGSTNSNAINIVQ